MEIYRICWNEAMQMVRLLARGLQDKRVWGIPRGGQVVATLMAYQGCKLVKFATEAEVIVDDIADTGTTLFRRTHDTSIKTLGLPTATLIVRNSCTTPPNHYIMRFYARDYVLFPWEDEEEAFEYVRLRKENDSE